MALAMTLHKPRGLLEVLSVGWLVGAVLSAIGTFKEADKHYAGYAASLVILTVGAAIVYAIASRALHHASGGKALGFSVVGFLSLALFWSGLPVVVAAAALAMAARARDEQNGSALVTASTVVSVVVVALAVFLAFVG